MYYWYNKKKDLPGSDMGGFTRILHTGKKDNLMDEIPTFIVDPLPNGLDQGYVVLNRPWAFVQWLKRASIDEDYILMVEPDHLILKPLPNLACGDYPVGSLFDYMQPKEKSNNILRKFFPEEKGPVTLIDPTGNSPVLIKKVKRLISLIITRPIRRCTFLYIFNLDKITCIWKQVCRSL
ncbi:hypothetical protein Leryth_001475 [Lithospermum erythrorhizon]|nr:hypothetical protein Leryth_001475 [Lithospermum erythrorhizon]